MGGAAQREALLEKEVATLCAKAESGDQGVGSESRGRGAKP